MKNFLLSLVMGTLLLGACAPVEKDIWADPKYDHIEWYNKAAIYFASTTADDGRFEYFFHHTFDFTVRNTVKIVFYPLRFDDYDEEGPYILTAAEYITNVHQRTGVKIGLLDPKTKKIKVVEQPYKTFLSKRDLRQDILDGTVVMLGSPYKICFYDSQTGKHKECIK